MGEPSSKEDSCSRARRSRSLMSSMSSAFGGQPKSWGRLPLFKYKSQMHCVGLHALYTNAKLFSSPWTQVDMLESSKTTGKRYQSEISQRLFHWGEILNWMREWTPLRSLHVRNKELISPELTRLNLLIMEKDSFLRLPHMHSSSTNWIHMIRARRKRTGYSKPSALYLLFNLL